MRDKLIHFLNHNRVIQPVYVLIMSIVFRNKALLMNAVKTSATIKKAYRTYGSLLIRLLGLFVRTDDKLVLLNSYGGKKYDDSSKALYEWLINDPRFNEYKFVWAFHEPNHFVVPGATIIKTDTLRYFVTALRAKIWITNSGIERGLHFKKKNTIYMNTWHGTPIKFMGADEYRIKSEKMPKSSFDYQNVQSDYEADIFSRAFNIPREKMLMCGYPRNDILINNGNETQKEYKAKLGISVDKKIILYAPTFRDYERDPQLNCVLKLPIDFNKWRKALGCEYVVLIRRHYEVVGLLNDGIDGDFVRDMSDYPVLNDLMMASDILISDYSSIMFDFSILDRPIYVYTYDYDKYKEMRGMYFDVREELPGGSISEEELLSMIKNGDKQEAVERVKAFRRKYVTAYGHATEATVNTLYQMIMDMNL